MPFADKLAVLADQSRKLDALIRWNAYPFGNVTSSIGRILL